MFPDKETVASQLLETWQQRLLPYDHNFALTIGENLVKTFGSLALPSPSVPEAHTSVSPHNSPPETLFTCRQVLEQVPLPAPVPEEGWLPLAYRYIQGCMFSDAPCFTQDVDSFREPLQCFLTVLQWMLDWEQTQIPFHPFLAFQLLSPEEYESCDCSREYRTFVSAYRQEFIYELMRLGEEITPYRSLGHMGGVHHIALTMARGLERGGIPIDLALVSGSAMSHDFGKFGCRPGERVPYLH